jgi:membrane-associated protease RseP (regulator of RpoE activity)
MPLSATHWRPKQSVHMLFRKEAPLIKSLSSPFLPLFFTLFLTACASGYKEFYKQAQGAIPETVAAMRVAPPPATPIVEHAEPGDSMTILDVYAKRGYIMIGNSMFKSGHLESEDSAVRQAQDVGADLVLILNPRYAGSMTSSIPQTTLTRTTQASIGATDDITNYVVLTIPLADYGAVYFVKQRFELGVFSRDLNDAEQELQTNQGAVVRLVVDGSPAFNADLQIGDVVIAVDGVAIANAQAFNELLRERRGKRVDLSIVRRGQRLEKTVQL